MFIDVVLPLPLCIINNCDTHVWSGLLKHYVYNYPISDISKTKLITRPS